MQAFDPAAHTERQAIVDLCNAWGRWQREAMCINGQAQARAQRTAPPAVGYMQIVALHTAIQAQPQALDRQVFEAVHLMGVRNIKAEAARLGVSRTHWYRLLWAFQDRVWAASQQIAASAARHEAFA